MGIRTGRQSSPIKLPQLKLPRLPRLQKISHMNMPRIGVIRVRRLKDLAFKLCVLGVILLIAFGAFQLIRPGIRIRVDADTVAAFQVPHRAIGILRDYSEQYGIPFPELFAVFNAENDFFPDKTTVFDLSVIETLYVSDFRQIKQRYSRRSLQPYVEMFANLFDEIEVFPIPAGWYEHDASIMFGNSWGVEHNFQGRPMHMGTAIIDRENIRGRVPVVSMTHGQVQEAGWDRQLGYFAKILSENGTTFLYAHLDSLANGITPGQRVFPGQGLGQMGNSGGGRSGQSFPVHLHIAIAPEVSFTRGQFWINPYPILRYLESLL